MVDPQEHVLDKQTGEHVETGGDDGACLVRHVGDYKKGNSCSHRWQAFRKAQEYPHWYNYPAYASLVHSEVLAKSYRPTEGSWNLTANSEVWRHDKALGKAVQKSYPNFQERADVPYSHNSHHVIPNSVFNGAVLDAAKADMRVYWVTRAALLKAKYNLNDKENMIILPMRKAVANAIGLPRHISGIDTEPGQSPERCNHSAYNDRVRTKVKKVISDFASQIKLKEHDLEMPEFAKAKLLEISQTLFMKLRVWGATAKGLAINAMPKDMF
jgi:hypothetical protein